MLADYSYASHVEREEADAGIRFWEIIFDPIGGRSPSAADSSGSSAPWKLDDPERKSLHISVAGQAVRGKAIKKHNSQDGALFGSSDTGEDYDLEITKVEHVVRRFEFKQPKLGFFGTIRRFFGGDVWKEGGELVYLSEEWSVWGKKGTLRNWVGQVFHSTFVGLIFIIIGSIVGGFITLRIIHSLWLFVKQQSGLARWKGIDAVYSQLNQGGGDDERWDEQRPWDGRNGHGHWDDSGFSPAPGYQNNYRDSYESGPSRASMGWQEERMKPLPTKPLPEKPLPQEPLIDT